MIPSDVRAIFFDAVGTLLHPDPPAPQVYEEIGRRHGSRRTSVDIAARFRAAFQRQEQWDYERDLQTNAVREEERWRQIVSEVLDDLPYPEACFQELFAHFGRPASWCCDPDATVLIAELAQRDYLLGLASNYDQRLRAVMTGFPDLHPLRWILISAEIGWRKPSAHFFKALSWTADKTSKNILYIGDDLINDIEGAGRVGMKAILFDPRQQYPSAPQLRIIRLRELLAESN